MKDITIIMMTPNLLPQYWADYHKKILLQEIGDTPLITISAKPLDFGMNLIQDGYGVENIYRQMLRGAKLATTPFIGIADDDTLYPREHFEFRPTSNEFYYNYNRWHILEWKVKKPYYFYKPRPGNGCMIAPRKLMIEAIESRFESRKLAGKDFYGWIARELGSTRFVEKYDKAGYREFYTYHPVVSFYHIHSMDPLNQRKRKVPWPVQAFDLPKWGRADKQLKIFLGKKHG